MVAATAVVVGLIIATGGAAAPAVAAAATEGIAASAAVATGAAGTGVAVVGGTGTAAAARAITGAVAGGTVGAVGVGGAIGATTAAGVSSLGGGAASAATAGLLAGPVGWICLGAGGNADPDSGLNFDCWKPLLHEPSTVPSGGRLLRDIVSDPRIKDIDISTQYSIEYPQIRLRNIWDEQFELVYVQLPSGTLAAHALAL